jgi:hypothetical protein
MDKQRDITYMFKLASAIKSMEAYEYEQKTKDCFKERVLRTDNGNNSMDYGVDNSQQISVREEATCTK